MAIEVGTAYVSLTADARSLGKTITKDLTGALEKVGQQIGKDVSTDMAKSLDGTGKAAGKVFSTEFTTATKGAKAELAAVDGVGRDAGRAYAGEFTAATRGVKADIDVDGGAAGRQAGTEFANQFENTARATDVDLRHVASEARPAGENAGGDFSTGFGHGAEANVDSVTRDWLVKVVELLKTKLAAAAVLVGAALTKGVFDTIGAEANTADIQASLGLTPERAAELGTLAGAVYRANYGESLGQVSDTIGLLFKNGLIPPDASAAAIEEVSSLGLTIADTFEQDIGGVTRAASNLIRNGLAPDAVAALDLIARGFQSGVDKSDDYLDTLNEYGTQFRKLGLDGVTATGLIRQGLQGGARDGDLVADALKEFSIRAVDGSELTAESFQAIGLSADDMISRLSHGGPEAALALGETLEALKDVEDPAKRAQIAVGLFGTQSEDLGQALYNLNLGTAAAEMGNVAGAATDMSNVLGSTVTAKIETFRRQGLGHMQDFAAKYVVPALYRIGEVMQTYVGPALVTAAQWIQTNVVPALQDLAAWAQEHVVPALQALGDWILTNVVPALQTIGAFIRDEVIPALGALGDWITTTLIPALSAFWDWLVINLTPAIESLRDQAALLVPGLEGVADSIMDNLVPALQEMWRRFVDDIFPILKTVTEYVLQNVVPAFLDFQTKIDQYVLPILQKLIDFIAFLVDGNVRLYDALKTIGKAVADFAKGAKDKIDDLVDFFEGLPDRISSAVSGMWDGIGESFRGALNYVIDLWNGLSFPGISVGGVQVSPGFGTPHINHLATGGVITEPTLAFVGETARARPEIVAPQRMMADTFAAELDRRGGAGATFHQTFVGTNLTAQDVAAETAWQLRTRLGVLG